MHRWPLWRRCSDDARRRAPPAEARPVLAEAVVARLLDGVDGGDPHDRRDRVLLELLYDPGLRISQVVDLTIDDLADRALRVGGDPGRLVPVGEPVARALGRWLAPGGRDQVGADGPAPAALLLNLQGGPLSRQGAWAAVRRRGEEAGLVDLHPNSLRRAATAHLRARRAPAAVVRQLLGQPGPLPAPELAGAHRRFHPRASAAVTPALGDFAH